MRMAWEILRNVEGPRYAHLLEVLLRMSAEFGLVSRPELRTHVAGMPVLRDLEPLRVRTVRTCRWPGTLLLKDRVPLSLFRSEPAAMPHLLQPGSLFSWRAPEWPEDLFFRDANGEAMTSLVAHERRAWILSPRVAKALGQQVTLEKGPVNDRDVKILWGVP